MMGHDPLYKHVHYCGVYRSPPDVGDTPHIFESLKLTNKSQHSIFGCFYSPSCSIFYILIYA